MGHILRQDSNYALLSPSRMNMFLCVNMNVHFV